MKKEQLIELALEKNFHAAAIIKTTELVFEPSFRAYCEENLCGQYGANYSCPPDCGTPESMKQQVLNYQYALVLQSVWDVTDYSDMEAINRTRNAHNEAQLQLLEELRALGFSGIMMGCGNCTLCDSCAIHTGEPCRFPEKRFSCLSAYCIEVKNMTDRCGMSYNYGEGKLSWYGICAFRE